MHRAILSFIFIFIVNLTHIYAYEHNLAICAIFQNEAPYLKEWVEFHKLVGVEHFYLYNHESTDHYLEVLKPYIEQGEVTLYKAKKETFLPYANPIQEFNAIQCASYTDAIRQLSGKVKWIAFIDTDEFLFPVHNRKLTSVLKAYEECSGIGVNWHLFGTSHVEKIPADKLLIEVLLNCSPKNYQTNIHIKSIIRPERVDCFRNPHYANYKPGYYVVNTDKVPFEGPFSPYIQLNKLKINHYWTRDEYYLKTYKIPRRIRWGGDAAAVQKTANEINQDVDTDILKFVPQLREKMGF